MCCFASAILEFGRCRLPDGLNSGPAVVLGIVYATVMFAGFLAPYDYETQNRLHAFAPPTTIHFVDEQGRVHLRPFVYALKPIAGLPYEYEQDRSVAYPLCFFVAGAPYRFLGRFRGDLHLFGTRTTAHIFLLGTDALGRDLFTRLLYGGQISLLAAIVATAISVSMGLLLGGIAGYYGTWTDDVIMRTAELFLSVPWLYLLLVIRAFLPLHLDATAVFLLLMLVSGLTGWGRPARLVRGIILSTRNREYVLAARGFGASDFYILRRHVLPQAYRVSITQAALYIPQYITAEVALSFFGLGVSEPTPSWGNMLAGLRTLFVLQNCWWMFAPAAALVLVLAVFQWLFRIVLTRSRVSEL
jgi:peptide/nickel transport system permease protein